MRGGAPSDSSHNHTPIPSTFPEEEEEWNMAKTPKSGRVIKAKEKEHYFAPLPTNPIDPLDNPFTGSMQSQTGKGGRISAMSMRSDWSSMASSDSDEERERADVEKRHLEDEGIIGDGGNIDPALIVGYIWEGEKAILDNMAPYCFVRRGDVDISNVADHVQALSSNMFNWCTMGYLITDIFSKSRIEGNKRDFMYFMYRLASLANTMGDKNVGRILEQMAGSDHLLHRANQKLDDNKAAINELRDKVRAGEIRLGGANKLIAKLQG